MKHGETINVGFFGSLPRTQIVTEQNGVALNTPVQRNYWRNNFLTPDGKVASVRCDANIAGKAGYVMFVEKGQPLPGNQPGTVANDGWSLVSITDSATVAAAKEAAAALAGFKL